MSNDNKTFWQQIGDGLRDMCYIWWLEMKNIFLDEGALIFMILVPIGYPLLYSWIYNNEVVREVPVAVVDLSHSQPSREFLLKLDGTPDVNVKYYCSSMEEARDLVGRQVVRGIVYFPADFSTRVGRGEQAHVGVYCDMSTILTYKAIYKAAQAVASSMSARIQIPQSGGVTERDDEINSGPLLADDVQLFNTTGGYGNFLLPAVLMLILQQTLLLGIGLSAGTARENNRYRELVPVSRHYNGIFRIVFGKSMCYFMIYCVMAAYITLAVPRFFSFTTMYNPLTLLLFMLPYILSCIFFGMMLSGFVRYRENVMLLVVFTSVPFLFLSGVSWPESNIPAFWKSVSYIIPSTFGIQGYIAINSMGATLTDVESQFRALWIQTGVYFLLTCAVYRTQIITTRRHLIAQMKAMKAKLEE